MATLGDAAWHERDAFWETFAPSMFDERRRALAPTEVEQLVALAGVAAGARPSAMAARSASRSTSAIRPVRNRSAARSPRGETATSTRPAEDQ